MSRPRSRITRSALGCMLFGLLPALNASTVPSESCWSSASAICERALLPVQRKSTRGGRGRRRATFAGGRRRGSAVRQALRSAPERGGHSARARAAAANAQDGQQAETGPGAVAPRVEDLCPRKERYIHSN